MKYLSHSTHEVASQLPEGKPPNPSTIDVFVGSPSKNKSAQSVIPYTHTLTLTLTQTLTLIPNSNP